MINNILCKRLLIPYLHINYNICLYIKFIYLRSIANTLCSIRIKFEMPFKKKLQLAFQCVIFCNDLRSKQQKKWNKTSINNWKGKPPKFKLVVACHQKRLLTSKWWNIIIYKLQMFEKEMIDGFWTVISKGQQNYILRFFRRNI